MIPEALYPLGGLLAFLLGFAAGRSFGRRPAIKAAYFAGLRSGYANAERMDILDMEAEFSAWTGAETER